MLKELQPEKVAFVIVKAREFDVQEETPIDDGSNATDDRFVSVFTKHRDSSVFREIKAFIDAMNEDEQKELIALCVVGRGDYAPEEWNDALRDAASHPEPDTATYLLGMPTLADFLEEGLALFGITYTDYVEDRL